MGKWRNTDDSGEGSRPKMSDEQKKKAKEQKAKAAENGGGQPKATVADESRQATAPEKAMLGEDFGKRLYGQTNISHDDKLALEAKYKEMIGGKMSPEDFNKALYGSGMSQEDKLALDQSSYKGGTPTKGKKGKGGGKPAQQLPEGANPDEYYTGRWRTGKKPTPTPEAPKPPENVLKPWPIGGMPIEDMPPFPGYPGYPPQPKFPERGNIGGGPGQFPYPMPMPQPSWPPRGIGGFPPYYNPVPPWAQLPQAPTTGTPVPKMTFGTPGNWF